MNQTSKLLVSVIATALIVGFGTYFFVNSKAESEKEALQSEKNSETQPTTTTIASDQEALHAAFVVWAQTNTAGPAQKDPFVITDFKKSGEYVRFSASPAIYTHDVDPGFGFAKKSDATWTILSFGTGGDPTEFYKAYDIPKDLRDAGY